MEKLRGFVVRGLEKIIYHESSMHKGGRLPLEWEKSEDKRVGLFPRDIWALVLSYCVGDVKTLSRMTRTHPLLYILSWEVPSVRKALELPIFCEALSYAPMLYSKNHRICQHVATHSVSDQHDGRGSTGRVLIQNSSDHAR
jgi:hypothetical protein